MRDEGENVHYGKSLNKVWGDLMPWQKDSGPFPEQFQEAQGTLTN